MEDIKSRLTEMKKIHAAPSQPDSDNRDTVVKKKDSTAQLKEILKQKMNFKSPDLQADTMQTDQTME